WQNLHPLLEDQSERFVQIARRADWRAAPALVHLLPRVVERILSQRTPDVPSVAALLALLADRDAEHTRACLSIVSARARALSALSRSGSDRPRALGRPPAGRPDPGSLCPARHRIAAVGDRALDATANLDAETGRCRPGQAASAWRIERQPPAAHPGWQ